MESPYFHRGLSHFLFLLSFLLLFLRIEIGNAQVCEGNLGDNIFSIGDFGSGPENMITMDPGIAPGYIYTTNPPPSDGFYTITNNMALWSNLYGTWLPIQDNSGDPNGYMMVVNASFEPGIFYEELVENLCENTLYEFSADVINLIRTGVTNHIDPNVSFLLDGVTQYTTGNIDKDEKWHKCGFTFTTAPGQTSVLLTLRNNAPGGIGNDLALDNISFRPCGPDAFANAETSFLLCSNAVDPIPITAETNPGSSIQWQFYNEQSAMWEDIFGATEDQVFHDIFDPGLYLYRYLSAGSPENLMNQKCRVISDTASVTVVPIEFEVYDTLCEGEAYTFGNQILFEEGFYEETFIASNGCDSFVDLYLSIAPREEIFFDVNARDPSCFNFVDGLIEVINVTGGTGEIKYSLNDAFQNFSGIFNQLPASIFTLDVRDRYQCGSTIEISLNNPEIFTVDLGLDTLIELGEVYDFPIESNYNISSISWEGEYLECLQCLDNTVRPLEDGNYKIFAISEFGCEASDSIRIRLKDLVDQFYQPNIFSPNEDGINDTFRLFTRSLAVDFIESFLVFDRFGNKVYDVRNQAFDSPDLSWDGRTNGSYARVGVYTYIMNIRLITGNLMQLKGDVTLVR